MKYANKKVLIISHNPLSCVNNNGKTLASIFKGVSNDNIYQIYLNADVPDYSEECHYLQINEKQIFTSLLKQKNVCCQQINSIPGNASSAKIKSCVFANNIKRLLREGIWKFAFWKSKLKEWLKDKHFDVVFFMAGDGLFAYDVYRFVMKHTSAKGCLFFTDDYIIGKTSYSPVALLRQALLKSKIKKTLRIVDDLYVISEEMRKTYDMLFQRKSFVIRNFSIERSNELSSKRNDKPHDLIMVYAGGLHYNRWKVLSKIAGMLKAINQSSYIKCYLKIYSAQNISSDIIDQIVVDGASEFLGGASASQIADVYSQADILLHVESFDKKAVASTKYSFSTKIPEYLSAGKCVLAVGPAEVASVRYLMDFACVDNDIATLSVTLNKLIIDNKYREFIKANCKERFEKDFSSKKQEECLKQILSV